MTVHARRFARICRERMAARDEETLIRRQPEQQQQTTADADARRPEEREQALR